MNQTDDISTLKGFRKVQAAIAEQLGSGKTVAPLSATPERNLTGFDRVRASVARMPDVCAEMAERERSLEKLSAHEATNKKL